MNCEDSLTLSALPPIPLVCPRLTRPVRSVASDPFRFSARLVRPGSSRSALHPRRLVPVDSALSASSWRKSPNPVFLLIPLAICRSACLIETLLSPPAYRSSSVLPLMFRSISARFPCSTRSADAGPLPLKAGVLSPHNVFCAFDRGLGSDHANGRSIAEPTTRI